MLSLARRSLSRAMREQEHLWQWLYNGKASWRFRREPVALSTEARRVLADLERDGVAISSVDALLPDRRVYDELLVAGRALDGASHESGAEKDYNRMLLGESTIRFDPASIYARFALQSPFLEIANHYYRMWTRLRYFNLWHTEVTTGEPKQSQLWHRDFEDRLIVKCFVYLSDVDLGAGPFVYARGTHPKGHVPDVESSDERGVRRSTDLQMERVVPRERWLHAVGPAGTIVFADTRGYHKGGLARERPRLMYNCMWTSPACSSKEWFEGLDAPPGTPAMRAAACSPRRPGRFDWW